MCNSLHSWEITVYCLNSSHRVAFWLAISGAWGAWANSSELLGAKEATLIEE
jgi:hypothetical protein